MKAIRTSLIYFIALLLLGTGIPVAAEQEDADILILSSPFTEEMFCILESALSNQLCADSSGLGGSGSLGGGGSLGGSGSLGGGSSLDGNLGGLGSDSTFNTGGSAGASPAANNSFADVSLASSGVFSVNYSDGTGAQMRVGLSMSRVSGIKYYDYTQGTKMQYSFPYGSGAYVITLYRKTGGSSYATVGSVSVQVSIAQKYSEYLQSIREITFTQGDSVTKKADSLCGGKKTDQAKILAIYNYIAKNFKYDYSFADNVRSGKITSYCPVPTSILPNKKGVCYDFSSLFAAMCRSQGIPCKLVKGYSTKINGYHAWNSVYDSATDKWYVIDLTIAVCKKNKTASKFSGCCMKSADYTAKSAV